MNGLLLGATRCVEPAGMWQRAHGPMVTLPWLRSGRLLEAVPDWFVDLFIRTRDVSAISLQSDSLGLCSLEENWCLYRLVAHARPTDSLEIGVCRGATSLVIGRSVCDHAIPCRHTALDIDPVAIETVRRRFERDSMSGMLNAIEADSREWLPRQDMRWQYVFLDGDHAYDTAALEFVETYNRLDVGGWIILHDVGSVMWGLTDMTGPSRLLFTALDRELGEHAEIEWLDSFDRVTDMRILRDRGHQAKVRAVIAALADGWGGLGFVHKIQSGPLLGHDALRQYRLADRVPKQGAFDHAGRRPLLRRVVGKAARLVHNSRP